MNLIYWIAKERITQAEFAKKAGMGSVTFNKYKSGKSRPLYIQGVKMYEACNKEVSLDDILSGEAFKTGYEDPATGRGRPVLKKEV